MEGISKASLCYIAGTARQFLYIHDGDPCMTVIHERQAIQVYTGVASLHDHAVDHLHRGEVVS